MPVITRPIRIFYESPSPPRQVLVHFESPRPPSPRVIPVPLSPDPDDESEVERSLRDDDRAIVLDPVVAAVTSRGVRKRASDKKQASDSANVIAKSGDRAWRSPEVESSSETDILSTSSSALSHDEAPSDNRPLVSKPIGEAGRPGRGGYSLQKKLAWSPKEYRKLQQYVNALVDKELKPALSYTSQDREKLTIILKNTMVEFPQLARYQDCWPVTDMMKLRLKYTSSRARNAQDHVVTRRVAATK